jgi:putative acetyltransferase
VRRSPVHLRRGTPGDAAAVAAVMRASIRGLARGSYRPRQLARWSSLPPLYHAWAMTVGGETYLLAERAGRLVGYAALRAGEVTAVFVLPSAARDGVGRLLLARVERTARRRGVRALKALAATGAVGFYARCGYHPAGAAKVPLPGGAALEAVVVRKRLSPGLTGARVRSTRPRSPFRRRGAIRSSPARRG